MCRGENERGVRRKRYVRENREQGKETGGEVPGRPAEGLSPLLQGLESSLGLRTSQPSWC